MKQEARPLKSPAPLVWMKFLKVHPSLNSHIVFYSNGLPILHRLSYTVQLVHTGLCENQNPVWTVTIIWFRINYI